MEKISGCTIRFWRVANRLVKSAGVQRKRIGEFLRWGQEIPVLVYFLKSLPDLVYFSDWR